MPEGAFFEQTWAKVETFHSLIEQFGLREWIPHDVAIKSSYVLHITNTFKKQYGTYVKW